MKKIIIFIILLPWYFLAIFTPAKSFGKNPIIGNYVLNIFGLHIFRILLAYGVTHFRWLLLSSLLSSNQRKRFQQDGYILIENFLSEDMFQSLEKDIQTYDGMGLELKTGDTLTHHIFMDSSTTPALPAVEALMYFAPYRELLRYTASYNLMPYVYVQRILNGMDEGPEDPQKDLHKDTFQPTVKSWLFISDVTSGNGPFTYVPGSHRLTWKRLKWEYRQSLLASRSHDPHTVNGSFRLSKEDLEYLGYSQPKAFPVPKNSLVIANTAGFHSRGQALKGSTRTEIYTYSRRNPFIPFPWFDSRTCELMEKNMVHKLIGLQEDLREKYGKGRIWKSRKLDFRR